MSRIVLIGATGYQGRLTARALVERGLAPLLVGRNRAKLHALATQLGGADYAVVNLTDDSLQRLLRRGDVLVSTAGPFFTLGARQVDAVLAAGAHYLDSCGEPAFYRLLHQSYRTRAAYGRGVILTGCAYDFFPGNAVADHVLQLAGPRATRVDLGYFGALARGYRASAGSQASGLVSMLEPGLFFRNGALVAAPGFAELGQVARERAPRVGVSIAGTEHLFLPELYPALRDIRSYWGWGGGGSRALSYVGKLSGAIAARPTLRRQLGKLLRRVAQSDGSGPDPLTRERSASYVCAAAYDATGTELARAELGDLDGFSFTANIMAWSAASIARGELLRTGLTGPVQAFGRERLLSGHAEAGFELLTSSTPTSDARVHHELASEELSP